MMTKLAALEWSRIAKAAQTNGYLADLWHARQTLFEQGQGAACDVLTDACRRRYRALVKAGRAV